MNEYQKKLFDLISDRGNLGNLSFRKIGELIGLEPNHPQTIKYHLEQLNKRGLIELNFRENLIALNASGNTKDTNLFSIPILGSANCGEATMIADPEYTRGYLRVSAKLLDRGILNKKDTIFIIEASGDSMNKARIGKEKLSIEDGDYVIIDSSKTSPRNNDYVLSIIDGMANIKKFIQRGNQIALISESTHDYQPILIHRDDNYLVNGAVIQVIKRLKP